MDILDILLDILLKPPQPFRGLFFVLCDVAILNPGNKIALHPYLDKKEGISKLIALMADSKYYLI